jgi:8-oxo-dGTP pyrophosphatase MutT (NUDIX family)
MAVDDEWWDIVNSEGALTGETFRKGDAGWPSGSFHLIVAVCAQREDGAVLITQRAGTKKEFPFGWEFPGGSALAGESSRTAACRELWEETGLEVTPSALTSIGRFVEPSALLDFYVARVPSGSELTLQQSEVMASAWVTPDEVVRRLREGAIAEPWIGRMEALLPPTLSALSSTAH